MQSHPELYNIVQNIFEDVRGESNQIQVCCPRCTEQEGLTTYDNKFNLEISLSKRFFHCWRCEPRFSGSLGRLIQMYGSNIDYDLYKSYLSVYGDLFSDEEGHENIQVKLPDEIISFKDIDLKNKKHLEAYNYMIITRGFSKEQLLKYRIGFCLDGKYFKRIIIPSINGLGDVDYFIARDYSGKRKNKYDNPKASKNDIIFNEAFVDWDSTIFLVEGGFDSFSLPNAIPMLGKTISSRLFLKLKTIKPNIIVLLDPDAYRDSVKLFQLLENIYVGCEDRVKILQIPTTDDIDKFRKNRGIDEIIKLLHTARSLTTDDYFANNMQTNDNQFTRRYLPDSEYSVRK